MSSLALNRRRIKADSVQLVFYPRFSRQVFADVRIQSILNARHLPWETFDIWMDERLSEIPNVRIVGAICINNPTIIDMQHPNLQGATDKCRAQYLVLYRVIIFILGPSNREVRLPWSSRCVVELLPFPPSTCDLDKAVNLTRIPLLSTSGGGTFRAR
jgi:hypothetical protein